MKLNQSIALAREQRRFGVAPAGAEESSIEQARSIIETNFFGIVRMTRAVVRLDAVPIAPVVKASS